MANEQQSSSSSQSTSSSQPFAPEFIPKAGATIEEYKKNAYDAKAAQLQRLNDYTQHLHQLRDLAVRQARGAGARAGGQQNPLAVYQALNQMAAEAGVPMDAEIGKALQNSNSIENTLNSLIAKAGDAQIALANISKQQSQSTSQSQSGGGGSGANAGGKNGGRGPATGQNLDLNGNPREQGSDSEMNKGSKSNPKLGGSNSEMGLDPYGHAINSDAGYTGVMTNPAFNPGMAPTYNGMGSPNFTPSDSSNAGSANYNPQANNWESILGYHLGGLLGYNTFDGSKGQDYAQSSFVEPGMGDIRGSPQDQSAQYEPWNKSTPAPYGQYAPARGQLQGLTDWFTNLNLTPGKASDPYEAQTYGGYTSSTKGDTADNTNNYSDLYNGGNWS